MTEPAYQPGWYPDPSGAAAHRWHDGTQWTDHLHGDVPAPTPGAPGSVQPHLVPGATRTSGMAIWSLVTALLGIWILPIVLGFVARRRIRESAGTQTGSGLALAGIILGCVQLVLIPLVVMAIAVPTFLAQKDAAMATQATANSKMVANAVESCAVNNTDGSYTGCTSAAALVEFEPSIASALEACGSAGGVCIEAVDENLGYEITAMDQGTPPTTYTETHAGDGRISRACDGPACADAA